MARTRDKQNSKKINHSLDLILKLYFQILTTDYKLVMDLKINSE